MVGTLRDTLVLLIGISCDAGSTKLDLGPQRESLFYFGIVIILIGIVLLTTRSVLGIMGGKER